MSYLALNQSTYHRPYTKCIVLHTICMIVITTTGLACRDQPSVTSVQWVDVALEADMHFTHYNDSRGQYHYVETFGSGAAFLDYDGDGYLDIYLVNGAPIDSAMATSAPTNQLYHNAGNGLFGARPPEAGAGDRGYGMGVSAADYDGDGDTDLYVTNWGANALYRNDEAYFSNVTHSAGVGDPRWGTSAAFLDYDNDGDLDLFVANYVTFSPVNNVYCARGNVRTYCEPNEFPAQGDVFYRNDGTHFVDITQSVGITHIGRGLGVATSDYDGDGDTDLYVANDGTINFFYKNEGAYFNEVSLQTGTRFNGYGRAEAGMGVDWADYDNDGDTDLYVTNFSAETNTLYRNNSGHFTDVTQQVGLDQPTYAPLGFGIHFFDYDNDGFLDIFTANGHVLDRIYEIDSTQHHAQQNQLLRNERGERFYDVSQNLGNDFTAPHIGRGSAQGDYDNDGDIDLLLAVQKSPARLLRNDGDGTMNWLLIELVGHLHPDAIGTRVSVEAGGRRQLRERYSGGSYLSSSDPRLHFGLGTASSARIEITWPSGQRQTVESASANQTLRIVESASRPP